MKRPLCGWPAALVAPLFPVLVFLALVPASFAAPQGTRPAKAAEQPAKKPAAVNPGPAAKPAELAFMLEFRPGGHHSYLYYGEELGIFRKAGFKLNIRPNEQPTDPLANNALLLAGRKADAALMSADGVLLRAAKGAEIRSLLVLEHRNPVVLYSPRDRNISALADLYGKRVAVSTEAPAYQQYAGMCRLNGVDREKITELPMRPNEVVAKMISGEVDANAGNMLYSPALLLAGGVEISTIALADNGVALYGMTVIIGPSLMEDPAAAGRLKKALLDSLARTKADPKAAFDAMLRAEKLQNPKFESLRLELMLAGVFSPDTAAAGAGYQSEDGWKASAETLARIGVLEDTSVYKNIVWDK